MRAFIFTIIVLMSFGPCSLLAQGKRGGHAYRAAAGAGPGWLD